jgi:hypothetical protein
MLQQCGAGTYEDEGKCTAWISSKKSMVLAKSAPAPRKMVHRNLTWRFQRWLRREDGCSRLNLSAVCW